jgi:hypothetical protein
LKNANAGSSKTGTSSCATSFSKNAKSGSSETGTYNSVHFFKKQNTNRSKRGSTLALGLGVYNFGIVDNFGIAHDKNIISSIFVSF